MALDWKASIAIGEALFDEHPAVHPLRVRFTDLVAWIVALEEFSGQAEAATEKVLEAIQMVWWEEYKDENPDADPYGRT